MATKKEVKMRDLKPSKDAKGGAARLQGADPAGRHPAGRHPEAPVRPHRARELTRSNR